MSWAAPVRAAHSHGHLLRRGGGHPPLQGCVLWGACTAHASWVSRPWSPFGGAAMSRSQLRPDPPCRCLRSKCASCPEPAPPAVLAEGTLCPALFPDSLGIHCPLIGTAPPHSAPARRAVSPPPARPASPAAVTSGLARACSLPRPGTCPSPPLPGSPVSRREPVWPSCCGLRVPSAHRSRSSTHPPWTRTPRRACRWACAWCAAWTGSGARRTAARAAWARWWSSAATAAPRRPTAPSSCSGTTARAPTTARATRAGTTCCSTTTRRSVRGRPGGGGGGSGGGARPRRP